MTRYLIGTAFLALTACGSDKPPVAPEVVDVAPAAVEPAPVIAAAPTDDGLAYGDDWDISEFWPSEYPAGFSVIEDGVILPARAEMDKRAPRNVACPVPRFATYQAWNRERVDADNLRFMTATRIKIITLPADVSIEADVDGSPVTLSLKAGDSVRYLRYLSEGFATVEKDGVEYVIFEGDLYPNGGWEDAADETDLWLQLDCADQARTRAWLLFSEVEGMRGIIDAPITGYGEASDLGDIEE